MFHGGQWEGMAEEDDGRVDELNLKWVRGRDEFTFEDCYFILNQNKISKKFFNKKFDFFFL